MLRELVWEEGSCERLDWGFPRKRRTCNTRINMGSAWERIGTGGKGHEDRDGETKSPDTVAMEKGAIRRITQADQAALKGRLGVLRASS